MHDWSMHRIADLEFTLHGPQPVGAVGIRLRRFGERWVASSGPRGGIGVGLTPRAALAAAVEPFGAPAARSMLADLALLGPSIELVRLHPD